MVGCCWALSASADPAPNEGLRDFLFPPNQLKAVGPLSFALSKGSSEAQFALQQGYMLRAAAIG